MEEQHGKEVSLSRAECNIRLMYTFSFYKSTAYASSGISDSNEWYHF